MKISIIGAGWVGCHLAKSLMKSHSIDLFDESGFFAQTSSKNQNRLHQGFHYSRNYKTRHLCKDTFSQFIEEYPSLVKRIEKNIYSVPKNHSIIDYRTCLSIFKASEIPFIETNCNFLVGSEGSILTNEAYINPFEAKAYFTELLGKLLTQRRVEAEDLQEMLKNYDFIIDCTNNFMKSDPGTEYHELSLSLIYERIAHTGFDALTLVDGNFFSIYPYRDNMFTVTSVQHTPLFTSDLPALALEARLDLTMTRIQEIRDQIENSIQVHYPSFLENFRYFNYFTSIKAKIRNESADRSPIVKTDGQVIRCFTGKIQGIFEIENIVKKYINDHESINR
jgi:hypothetical protein